MKPLLLTLLFGLVSQSCFSQWCQPLTDKQIKTEVAYVLITGIDWMQTREFRAHGFKESNPILGEEPSQERVDTLIFLGIVSHVLITWMLPDNEWREAFQEIPLFFEVSAVMHNYSRGWGPKIRFQYKF